MAKAGKRRSGRVTPEPSPRATLGWRALAAIGVAGLAARLLHQKIVAGSVLASGLFLDSRYYAELAHSIRAGFGIGETPYLVSPLYPYILALFTDAEGTLAVGGVRLLQAVTGGLTCMLTADIASRIGDRRAGLVAGGLAAVYGPLIYFDSRILVASLMVFLLTVALRCLVARSGAAPLAGAGLALGLAAALRPTCLALLAAATVAPWITALRERTWRGRARTLLLHSALVAGAGTLAVLPFTVRNVVAGGEPVLLSANGGINFWVGNRAGANGVFRTPPDYDFLDDPLGRQIAARSAGRELDYREAGAWWRSRALEDIRANPSGWIRLMGRKLVLFAHPEEVPQLGSSFAWYRNHAWTLRFPVDARHLILFALCCPLVLYLRGGSAEAWRVRWPLLWIVAYWLTIILFFVAGRFRLPIVPALVVLAAITVVGLWDLLFLNGPRRKKALATSGGLLLLLIVSYPLYGRGSSLYYTPSFEGEERHTGMVLQAQGRHEEAIRAFRRSLEYRDSDATRNNLATALKSVGRFDEAAREYEIILRRSPRDGLAWYNFGNLQRVHLGDPEASLTSYRRAIEARPLLAEAHFNLGAALIDLARPAEAIDPIERALELGSPTDPWHKKATDALMIARFLTDRAKQE